MRIQNFGFLIGIAFFVFLLWFLGPERIVLIFETISRADPFIFAAAMSLIIPGIILKGIKQSLLLRPFGKKVSLKESCEIWLAGYLLGAISPRRSGDFLRPLYFKKNLGIKTGNGLSCVLLERIMDVGFLLLAGILGFIYFSIVFNLPPTIIFMLVIGLALFIACFFLLARKEIALRVGRPFFRRFMPKRFRERARQGFNDFYEGLSGYKNHKKIIFASIIITILSWTLFFFQAFLLAVSLKIGISLMTVSAIMPITTLAEIIPTVFGIGTRDFSLLVLFGTLEISQQEAISFSLLILLIEIIQAFFGAFFLRKIKNV